jgi:EmrB/QacA subfamily drug resistance transporter
MQTLSPTRQRLVLAAVMSGLLLAMLDQTIVGTALPRMVGDLGGASLYLWLVTAYLVPATVTVPIYARLSDRHGRRNLLLTGMALFLAGSALAGTAQDMPQLIAWRAVQGLGAGALEGLSFILVADLYGGRRNAALQAALAGLMGFSFLVGPLIGGFLTDHVGWRAVFTVNLPVGAAALAAVAYALPASLGRREGRGTPLDLAGIALLSLAIGVLLVALSECTAGTATTWRTTALVAAAGVLAAAFVAVERRAAAPVVRLELLTDRRTGPVLLAGAVGAFGLFAGALLLPRYFQSVRHVSATHSGLLIYPLLVGVVLSVNVAGAVISRRLEFRRALLIGAGLAAVGAAGFAVAMPLSLLWMALIGLGVGPTLSGVQIALVRSVPPAAIAGALGTLMLLRQVGASLAFAAATVLYDAGGPDRAQATGHAVFLVTLAGAAVAAAALVSLPRGAGRLPALQGAV